MFSFPPPASVQTAHTANPRLHVIARHLVMPIALHASRNRSCENLKSRDFKSINSHSSTRATDRYTLPTCVTLDLKYINFRLPRTVTKNLPRTYPGPVLALAIRLPWTSVCLSHPAYPGISGLFTYTLPCTYPGLTLDSHFSAHPTTATFNLP